MEKKPTEEMKKTIVQTRDRLDNAKQAVTKLETELSASLDDLALALAEEARVSKDPRNAYLPMPATDMEIAMLDLAHRQAMGGAAMLARTDVPSALAQAGIVLEEDERPVKRAKRPKSRLTTDALSSLLAQVTKALPKKSNG